MAVNSQLSEEELLNRTVHYEASGEGIIGMALVALTIFNREAVILADNNKGPGTFNAKGSSLKDILMGKNQYQPVSEGKVNKNISAEARENVAKALELARNPRALQSELNKAGLSNSEITSLMNSTGFRTQGAKTDSSQPKAASYGNHNFTTAGNEDNALYVASSSGIATETDEPLVGPPVPVGTPVEDIPSEGGSVGDSNLVGSTGNPPDTLAPTTAGGPRTEASNNITPADAQTEALFPTSGAGPGSILIPQDPNNYYSSNLSGEPVKQQQLNQTIPLSKLGERPLEDRELDAGLSTGTEKQARSTEAARLQRIKDMKYSRDELRNRRDELGLTDEQLDEIAFEEMMKEDYMSVESNPTEDEYLGDILQGLFEQGDAVDEVSNQGYEEPSAMAEQNLAEGGPVERQVKFVKNNNDEEEEEKELPDPPPGATPKEVADDVPVMLSTGEYVLPANVVRYIGLDRIVGMHKSVLYKIQQMTDLGIIQNVDHNGDPEDDNTEMDFIQEPEVTSEKKLMVIIEPKGMMSPAHFADGGEVLSEDTLASTSDIFADGIYSTANLERAIDSPEVVESTESINAPIAFSSEPGKTAYLAYITPEEASSLRQSGQGYSAEGKGQEVLPNLYQHIGPKGLMSFNGAGEGNDPNADNTDADTGSTATGKGKAEDEARDKAQRDFEAGLVDESRNQSGGQTNPGAGFGGVHGMSDPSKGDKGGAGSFVDNIVEGLAKAITRDVVGTLVGLHDFGNKAQTNTRAGGGKHDTPVNEGDHAQGYSGRGIGVDVGEPSGVSGAGDNVDDSVIRGVDAPQIMVITPEPKVFIPGLGYMSRGGIMGYHEGGEVVDDLGVVDIPGHTHEDTSVGVNYAPADYEDYKAKVFGTRLRDPAFGGQSSEDWAKSYEDSGAVDAEENKRRKELASSLNFGGGSVTNWGGIGGNEVFKANRDVANYLTKTQGLDNEEIASVIHNFRAGRKNIFSNTSKFNFAGENESAIAYLTSLAEGLDAQRKGITDADIGEGQTNRDVLKRVFAADFDSGAIDQGGEELTSDKGNTAFDLLINTDNDVIKDYYNIDLDANATVDDVNRFMPIITSGGTNAPNNYAGETYEDVVARGDKTPAEQRQGIMSKVASAQNQRYVEGLGVV